MHLVSINIAKAQPIHSKSGMSGIFKQPVTGPVKIGPLGLEGDAIVDNKNHGGLDQAVYVFGTPDYEWWAQELERELPPGIFGENLTVTELQSAACNVGDRLRTGSVLLEVTSPRVPCATLAARMGDPKFVKRFVEGERFGVYCRVLETGVLQGGEAVEFEPFEGVTVSALELFRAFYARSWDEEMLRRAVQAPMHHGMRSKYEALLQGR